MVKWLRRSFHIFMSFKSIFLYNIRKNQYRLWSTQMFRLQSLTAVSSSTTQQRPGVYLGTIQGAFVFFCSGGGLKKPLEIIYFTDPGDGAEPPQKPPTLIRIWLCWTTSLFRWVILGRWSGSTKSTQFNFVSLFNKCNPLSCELRRQDIFHDQFQNVTT